MHAPGRSDSLPTLPGTTTPSAGTSCCRAAVARTERVRLDCARDRDPVDSEGEGLADELLLERGMTSGPDSEQQMLHTGPGHDTMRQPGSRRISDASAGVRKRVKSISLRRTRSSTSGEGIALAKRQTKRSR